MIFLLEYDRAAGSLVKFFSYKDEDRARARNDRLELELDLLRKGIAHEVVSLEASSEEMLHLSHGRYFKSVDELAEEFREYIALYTHQS